MVAEMEKVRGKRKREREREREREKEREREEIESICHFSDVPPIPAFCFGVFVTKTFSSNLLDVKEKSFYFKCLTKSVVFCNGNVRVLLRNFFFFA